MGFSVGCFGYGGTVALIEMFREDIELSGIEIKTCHEHPTATVPYSKEIIFSFIDSCDIIVLPCRVKLQPAKSVNRLALALSRKKACVASPLDAYKRYFKDGEHVLYAETKEQWLEAILRLRDDAALRNRIAENGHKINLRLHPSNQISKLLIELNKSPVAVNKAETQLSKLFVELDKNQQESIWPKETFLQIIIPHYAPRLDYLELAVKAAVESWGPERDILIVSSSKADPNQSSVLRQYSNVRIMYENSRKTFSQANNIGIKNAKNQTTHFLLLNDDTILSQKALGNMVKLMSSQGNNFILNPWSNCDKRWLHDDNIVTSTGKSLHPNMRIEDFSSEDISALFKMESIGDAGLSPAPFCAFYCTMIPKQILDAVGMLNTLFKNGGEDLDFCERAKRFGFQSYWTKEAFCFHFGGKTRAVSESENYKIHHQEDFENNVLVKKRWLPNKKRIAIWTGPAWETWDLDTYKTTGIGGAETCAGRLAQIAAENGHVVTLYGAHELKEQDGVQLMPWDSFRPEEEYFDLFIASRTVNCIDQRLKAKKVLVWTHDIWLMSGKEVSAYHRDRVDKFICLSPWHVDFFSDHHQMPKDKIITIPNGVNVELFDTPDLGKKKFGKLIYSSSPDRGLDNLIYLMIFAKDQVPELHLDVYYGFHNYESAVRQRNNVDEVRRLDELKGVIEKHSDFVNMYGRISQPDLAKRWSEAYAWIQPTNFTETFCLTAKEAQTSATPIVCSNVAALQTTVGDFGHLVKHNPYSYDGRLEFINQIVKLHKDKDYWLEMSKKSLSGAANISWGDRWRDYWNKWL